MIAKIIIDISHTHVNKAFDYRVPESLGAILKEGMRVNVFFHGTKRSGVVVGFKKTSREKRLKSIHSLIELTPTYSYSMLELAKVLSQKYARPIYDYFKLLTPIKKRVKSEVRIFCDYHPEKYGERFKNQSWITHGYDDASIISGLKNHDLRLEEVVFPPKLKTTRVLSILRESPVKGKKQQQLITLLKQFKQLDETTIIKVYGISKSTINSLIEKAIIHAEVKPSYLNPGSLIQRENRFQFSQDFLNSKIRWIKPGDASTLGSLVASLIDHHDASSMTYIVCPEANMARTMVDAYKDTIEGLAIFDVNDSFKKQFENTLKFDSYHVMIGTMHGLMAHLEAVDHLIVIDGHDASYSRALPPFFDLKDLIAVISHQEGTITHLTHTLSLKDYVAYKHGDMIALDLGSSSKANLQLIEPKPFNPSNSILREELIDAIHKTLDDKRHVLIIHNFRGKNAHVACPICHKKARCQTCDEILSLQGHQLICPNGHESNPIPLKCPDCQVPMVSMYEGIEATFQALKSSFPDIHVVKGITNDFDHIKQLETPSIILGFSQLIKRASIRNVGLKALIDFDRMVSLKSYDMQFQTFALLHKLLDIYPDAPLFIQTRFKNHPVIEGLKDPNGFYEGTLKELNQLNLPPFIDMAQIVFEPMKEIDLEKIGLNMVAYLKKATRNHVTILGPSYKMNRGVITLKSSSLSDHYAAFNNLVKAFMDEVRIEIKHAHFEV